MLTEPMAPHSKTSGYKSKFVIYAALGGNILVALTKLAAAWWTGSSAMLSEGIHSVVDSGNELLLLYGMWRASRPADRSHPLGHGRELYFWSFVVALLVFALGACVSIAQGIRHALHPEPIENVNVTYVVLGLSFLFDGASWLITLRSLKSKKGYAALLDEIHESKDPPSFIVLFEDSAALIGLALAFIGIYLSQRLELPVLDGVASIAIGLVLALAALALARETKGLLIGEPATQGIIDSIVKLAAGHSGITHADTVFTVHLSPEQILVALSVEFADELRTPDIENAVIDLEKRVHNAHPAVVAVFIKPQTSGRYQELVAARLDGAMD
jgi:cation diffusion facilitator family transporter